MSGSAVTLLLCRFAVETVASTATSGSACVIHTTLISILEIGERVRPARRG